MSRVHDSRLAEILFRLSPFGCDEIPYANRIPAHRRFGLLIYQLVGQNEKSGVQVIQVIHARNMQWDCWKMNASKIHDSVTQVIPGIAKNEGSKPRCDNETVSKSKVGIK